ncbi:MAG: arginine--tRNA ligase [Phycisphaera sp.]|nr:arginine--tRNA ligase [Phycisphaera sp.]
MADPITILQDRFRAALTAAFGQDHADTDPILRPAQNTQFGDYQSNVAMSLAKTLGKKPRDVADEIVKHLEWQNVCSEIPGVAGPGFINLKLDSAFLNEQLAPLVGDTRLGVTKTHTPDTVVVDYSGPNVAKEMHVGHLRSTIIGDCIARVLVFAGDTVIRQNHLGDWGTQFGMLIEHLIEIGRNTQGAHVKDLNVFYQDAKKRFDSDKDFADRARKRVVALQGGDKETLSYWHTLIDESKRHFNEVYQRLGVQLTDSDIRAESSYNDKLPGVVADLEKAGVLKVSQGASCVFPEGFKDPDGNPLPMIVRKSDGGYLYATTDLAAARYRIDELHATRIVYVIDSRQSDHLAMVFATLRAVGWSRDGVKLEHVAFGTVLGPDRKPFKTREGGTVKLIDLVNEAEARALKEIESRNADLPTQEKKNIAHTVGIGALKYADLSNDRIKDYVFDWDRMLAFDGNTAPYLQYSYTRIKSIFRKAPPPPPPEGVTNSSAILIVQPAERALAIKLLQLPGVIQSVAESLEPHRLCTYLYELAAAYHKFYETCPVLSAPDVATRSSRLALCDLCARTIAKGLELLGIGVVEQM